MTVNINTGHIKHEAVKHPCIVTGSPDARKMNPTTPSHAPVICIRGPDPSRAGDSGDSVGLKCQVLTSDESRCPSLSYPLDSLPPGG